MKKNLLLCAALLAGSASVALAQTDITPSGYKWNETGVVPTISTKYVAGGNLAAPAATSVDVTGQYDNGLIGININNADSAKYTSVVSGLSIVDFGGEVGKVLAVRGANCTGVDSTLNAVTGQTDTIPKMTSTIPFFHLNFFTDPNNTPTSSASGSSETLPTDNYIHVKVVFNLYTDDQTSTQEGDAEQQNISGVYCKNNAVGQAGGGPTVNNKGKGNNFYAYNFFVTETEGEYTGEAKYDDNGNAQWDPSRWVTVEWDTFCPQGNADGGYSYSPLYLDLSIHGFKNFATETLFVKEISFTSCTGTPSEDLYKTAKVEYTTIKPGTTNGIKALESATQTVNSPKYNLAGQRVNDSFKGIVIQNGQKTIVR